MSKKATRILINIICEGQTEISYMKNFAKNYLDDKIKINFINAKQGNYLSLAKIAGRFKATEQIVFVIADLDRLANDKNELKHFEKLISTLKQVSNLCNIFLTYKNYETFLSAHFSPYSNNLPQSLNKNGYDEIKNDDDIYECIKRNGGNFENTQRYFDENNLFYNKINDKFPKLHKDNIQKIQSNLINFIKYCNYIKKIRK